MCLSGFMHFFVGERRLNQIKGGIKKIHEHSRDSLFIHAYRFVDYPSVCGPMTDAAQSHFQKIPGP